MGHNIILKMLYSIVAIALCGVFLYYIWRNNLNIIQIVVDKKLWIALAVIIIITATTSWSYRSKLKHLFLFTFSPTKFIEHSAEVSIQKECETNSGFKKNYETDEAYKKKAREQSMEQFSDSTIKIKSTIRRAFVMVLLILVCSALTAYILVNFITINEKQLFTLQVVSAFLILWALMGKVGMGIATYSSNTLPEQINNFWFLLLNVVGMYFLFFTYFFKLIKK